MYINKNDDDLTQELLNWFGNDLPNQVQILSKKTNPDSNELKKRDQPDGINTNIPKQSILQRIKPRDDINHVKAEITTVEKVAELEEPKKEKATKDPQKVKCNFWPSCKKPECPYAHPKKEVE